MGLVDEARSVWWSLQLLLTQWFAFLWHVGIYLYNLPRRRQIVPPVKNPLLLKSATQLAEDIRNRKIKSHEVVSAFVERIKEVNPIINAVSEENFTNALREASEVDEKISGANQEEIAKLAEEKPLFGVPFTCKDHFFVKDTYCTLGAWSRREYKCDKTEAVIQKMFDAGGILLGKTTVPEMCLWIESQNALHGFTNNPYDSRRNAGGSSGGEGALLAAAGSVIGVGSDIGGSIRVPSALNGVYGLKTSPEVFPNILFEPHNDIEDEFAVAGPMCRYVDDVELMAKFFAKGKPASVIRPAEAFDFKSILVATGFEVPLARIVQPEMQEAAEKVAGFLCDSLGVAAHGSIDFSPMTREYLDMFVANFDRDPKAPTLHELFEVPAGPHNPLTEVPKYFFGRSKHSLAAIIQYPFVSKKYSPEECDKYHQRKLELRAHFDSLLSSHSLVVMPGWPNVAGFHHQELANPDVGFTGILNILRLPSLVCPIGLNKDGLPLSVQLVGPRGSDLRLVEIAQKIDEKFGGWVEPGMENKKLQ